MNKIVNKKSSDELEVFISYSSKNQNEAEKVYKMFEGGEINCFLSTPDLKAGEEWEPILFQKLMSSNFFILMLSEDFFNSYWCNQEAGIAYSRYVCDNASLIPIRIDETIPYGILHGIQSKGYEEFDSLEEFAEIINDKTFSFKKAIEIIKNKQIDKTIEDLNNSKGFDESNDIFEKLKTMDLSPIHIDFLLEVALGNFQVSHCDNAPNFFLMYFNKYKYGLNEDKVQKFKDCWPSVFGKKF